MWSIPGARHYDNCELYFDSVDDDEDYLDRRHGHYLGRGVGYSYKKQDASEWTMATSQRRRRLAIAANDIGKAWPIRDAPSFGYPRSEDATYFIGCGWSALMSYENPCHYPTDDLVFGSGRILRVRDNNSNPSDKLQSAENEVSRPERLCTLDDEKIDVSGTISVPE